MKIPHTFLLKGKRWKVLRPKVIKVDGEVCDGLCSWHTRTIRICSDLPQREAWNVFLHELFHAVLFEAHINRGARFSEGLEDVICDAFTDVIASLFSVKLKRDKVNKK
jgi:hypothetical protein